MRLSALIFSIICMALTQKTKAQNLDDYQWKNRILVLADVASDTEEIQSQLQAFTVEKDALIDRDLVIFLLSKDAVYHADGKTAGMSARDLRERLEITSSFKGILLVGKDGGVKMKEEFQVEQEAVFSRIDGMPMRRAEMRKSGKL